MKSRNRIASTFIPQPPKPVVVLQNAFIDIMEPLTIGSGQSKNVAFRYITGEPPAIAFGMQWWASERDARNGLPPLTHNDQRPTQTFLPEVPQPNTGEFQDGIVAITVPQIDVAEEDFFLAELLSIKFKEEDMVILSRYLVALLAVLLLCCWGCGDPPTSVMELVLPDSNDTAEPPGENTIPATEEVAEEMPPSVNTMGLSEMEAILASEGEVHSPIPDDVYEQLWGEWTKVGLTTPRSYYTKYIDAGGIAIVGGDLAEDVWFQKARHIVLVMTSKLPGLREALSIDQPGGVTGDEVPFRLIIVNQDLDSIENFPENFNANVEATKVWLGACGAVDCWVGHWGLEGTVMHEMVHAIERAIVVRNLLPNFLERMDAAWEREMEKVELRWEVDGQPYIPYSLPDGTVVKVEDLPEWKDRPLYCKANSNSHDNASEFWAWFVEDTWFNHAFDPSLRASDTSYDPIRDTWRPTCPNMVAVTEEVFPAFPLHWAIHARDY